MQFSISWSPPGFWKSFSLTVSNRLRSSTRTNEAYWQQCIKVTYWFLKCSVLLCWIFTTCVGTAYEAISSWRQHSFGYLIVSSNFVGVRHNSDINIVDNGALRLLIGFWNARFYCVRLLGYIEVLTYWISWK